MVLPLVDEDRPKCHLCHEGFEDIERLREHQKKAHAGFFEYRESGSKTGPAPGDVAVF